MDDEFYLSDKTVNEDSDTTERDEETAIFNEKPHHKHNDSSMSSTRVVGRNKNHNHKVKTPTEPE